MIDRIKCYFYAFLLWLAHCNVIAKKRAPVSFKIWVKDKTIELWVHALEGLPEEYNDFEIVRKHPLFLRARLWLALHRIIRRNRKLTKFYLRQLAGG